MLFTLSLVLCIRHVLTLSQTLLLFICVLMLVRVTTFIKEFYDDGDDDEDAL